MLRILAGLISILLAMAALLSPLATAEEGTLAVADRPAQAGRIDAADWQWQARNLKLTGEWGFLWHQLLNTDQWHQPQPPWFDVPSTWDSEGSAGWSYPGQGFATFLLQVDNLPVGEELALFVPEVSTAFRLYANGALLAEGGRVGKQEQNTQPYSGDLIVPLKGFSSDSLRLILQVVNFHHDIGGPWQAMELGLREKITGEFYQTVIYDGLIATLMLVMALLLVFEYWVDPRDRTGLWLGAFALALGMRIGISDTAPLYWLLEQKLTWHWHLRLSYITMLVSPVFFLAWIHNAFPKDLNRKTSITASIPFLVSILICLVLPTDYFTKLLQPFSVLMFLVVIVGFFLLFRISWNRREGSGLLFIGIVAIGCAVTHDLLVNNQLITGRSWTATGLAVFILTQTANFLRHRVLQRRQIEFLSQQLTSANQELEHRVVLRTRDLAEKAHALEQANSQLQLLANVDSLSGLLNRRAFIEQVQQLHELEVPVALLWIDIDHFKQINDTYGHAAGDEVLKQFGRLMRTLGRDQDRLGRLGGEEFALLLLDCDKNGASAFARRLQTQVREMTFSDWPQLSGVTVSIGIAVGRLGEDRWQDLISQADHAMYEVKRSGRDNFRFS